MHNIEKDMGKRLKQSIKNPYVIIHGVHKSKTSGMLEVNWESIIPRENGETRYRGTTEIGRRIEIEVEEAEVEPLDHWEGNSEPK